MKDKENDLEFLIRVANEGMRAENILLTKYHNDIEREHTNNPGKWYPFTHNPYNGYSVYRVKPKATFEFYIGEKTCCWYDEETKNWSGHTGPCWTGNTKVKLENGTLHIEDYEIDYKFNALNICYALANLTRNSIDFQEVSNHRLVCLRRGICIDSNFFISWSDADRILKALEYFYIIVV